MGKGISQAIVVFICGLIVAAGSHAEFSDTYYVEIGDPVVVNYGAPSLGRLKYLRVSLQLRVEGESARDDVEHHIPAIRHALVMLFSKQIQQRLSIPQGKEEIRLEALALVQEVLLQEEGDKTIDDLLFINFVVQR
jgi:flagellar FliL protein